MQNENIELVTSGGHKIILKGFITGFDKRAISDAFMDGVELDTTGKPTPASASKQYNKTQDKAFEVTVVSVDGKTADIAKEVLSLPHTDTAEIIAKVNEVTSGKKKA